MSLSKSNITILSGTAAAVTALLGVKAISSYLLNNKQTKEQEEEGCQSKDKSKDKDKMTYYLLAGDVGGTNIRLAIYKTSTPSKTTTTSSNDDNNENEPLFLKEYRNSDYITDGTKTFEIEIIEPFLQDWLNNNTDVDMEEELIRIIACFAVAGPVQNNRVLMTNLGGHKTPDTTSEEDDDDPTTNDPMKRVEIEFNGTHIESSTYGKLTLIQRALVINDFVGQGYGCLGLQSHEVLPLYTPTTTTTTPTTTKRGPIVCVGAGTGLGECYLTPDDTTTSLTSYDDQHAYTCFASEGGHVDYTPRSELEYKLSKYLQTIFQQKYRISVERIVSGKGLANVYTFLSNEFPDRVNKIVQDEFDNAKDMQGRVVGTYANGKGGINNDQSDDLCIESMKIMMSAYGSEVGNCAVKFIPTGGLYVTGGLTPKNIDFIIKKKKKEGDDDDDNNEESEFMKAYWDKGRVKTVLENIPLFAVMVEDLGLRGAKVCALKEYKKLVSKNW